MQADKIYLEEDLSHRDKDLYAKTKRKVLLETLKKYKIETVLDAGCGTGELTIDLAKQGYQVIGIDPELKFIEYAESQAKKQGVENSTYINKNIEEYTSPTLFDCIVSTDVLEHIQDDLGVFNKLLTHLKPNGVCIIIVPALPILYGHHDKQLGHYRRYSKKMLTDLVSKQVRIQSTRYFGWSMLPVAFWYSKIIKQPYPVAQVGDYENKIAEIIDIVLQIDARIQLPFGTSLMLEGTLTPPSAPKA